MDTMDLRESGDGWIERLRGHIRGLDHQIEVSDDGFSDERGHASAWGVSGGFGHVVTLLQSSQLDWCAGDGVDVLLDELADRVDGVGGQYGNLRTIDYGVSITPGGVTTSPELVSVTWLWEVE